MMQIILKDGEVLTESTADELINYLSKLGSVASIKTGDTTAVLTSKGIQVQIDAEEKNGNYIHFFSKNLEFDDLKSCLKSLSEKTIDYRSFIHTKTKYENP